MIMTRGKNICRQLKEVRKRIAEENGIPLKIEECTYKGECRGTCPRCEAEVRYLENALAERLRIGKVATVAGLALGLATAAQAQAPVSPAVTRDSIAEMEYLPSLQSIDTAVHELQEERTIIIRGESPSSVTVGDFSKHKVKPPQIRMAEENTLKIKFKENNGTPARQSVPAEPQKLYEEERNGVKVIVR